MAVLYAIVGLLIVNLNHYLKYGHGFIQINIKRTLDVENNLDCQII